MIKLIVFDIREIENLIEVPLSILTFCITSIFYSIAYNDENILECTVDDILEDLSNGDIHKNCINNTKWYQYASNSLWIIIDELYRKIWLIQENKWLSDNNMYLLAIGDYEIEETNIVVNQRYNKIQVVLKLKKVD